MARVSGHIDAVRELVFDTYVAVNSEPVLQRQDGPHRRRIHMLVDDELRDLRRHLFGCIAPPTHLLVVELLGYRAVLFPPSAQRVHVVRTGRANRLIRSVGRVRKLNRRILGHALDLEAEDLQLMHHIRYASGHHTEVLAAAEHLRCADERRQFAHRRVTPELCMTAIEILVIDTHEHLFLVGIELIERVTLIDGDTRMEPSRTALILNHQHFAMEINQAVADILRSLFAQTCCFELFRILHEAVVPLLHFDLRIKLRTEPIDVSIARL